MEKKAKNELNHLWSTVGQQKRPSDQTPEIEQFKAFIQLFQIGQSYCFTFAPGIKEIEYCSESIYSILGYHPDKFNISLMLDIIHPDDKQTFLEFERSVVDFKKQLTKEQILQYKTQYNYRIQKKDGSYIPILQQSLTIETDEEGAIIRNFIVHTDLSAIKRDTAMSLSFISIGSEPSYLDIHNNLEESSVNWDKLSVREKEIVSCIAKNMTSNEIADRLCISKETVNTHRKNIVAKTEASGILELIVTAIRNNWI